MAQDTIPYPRTTAAQPHLSRSGKEEIRLKKEARRKKAQKMARYKQGLAKNLKTTRLEKAAKVASRGARVARATPVGIAATLTGLGAYHGTKKLLDVTGGTGYLKKAGKKLYSITHPDKKKLRKDPYGQQG